MKTSTKILIVVGVVILFSLFSTCACLVTVNNKCVSYEEMLKAQMSSNKNNYDNYFKKLKEVTQVPEMYVDDLKKVYDSAIKGRYGDGGSKATWQFLKEHNPNFDASLYKKIMQVIEGGRNDFRQCQDLLLDKKKMYVVYLKTFPNSMITNMFGFPKVDLEKIDIVTSDATEKIFETKKSDVIKLR